MGVQVVVVMEEIVEADFDFWSWSCRVTLSGGDVVEGEWLV